MYFEILIMDGTVSLAWLIATTEYVFFCKKMTEQDTKYLEDLQDEFDYRYKTIQTMGKFLFCLQFHKGTWLGFLLSWNNW